MRAIFEAADENYGVPRMHPDLRPAGLVVNHKRVRRLMRLHGMAGWLSDIMRAQRDSVTPTPTSVARGDPTQAERSMRLPECQGRPPGNVSR